MLLSDDESERLARAARGMPNPPLAPAVPRKQSPWKSHLTPEQVREIRASNESQSTLAMRFGVCRGTIRNVRNRETWIEVDD